MPSRQGEFHKFATLEGEAMTDSWCKPIRSKQGNFVSGGAARNVRIAASGGMDKIIDDVARDAAVSALDRADRAVQKGHLRLVKTAA